MNAKKTLFSIAFFSAALTVSAQQNGDKIAEYESFGKYRVGGYGEAVAAFKDYGSNRFYGHPEGNAKENRNTISIPRLVIAGDYKFNSKWILGLEIEFESGGTGTAYELENTENGEYETEVEKGGEVAIEQFHITRLITPAFNVRAGHIIVPVGQNNAHHEPLNFFGTVDFLPLTGVTFPFVSNGGSSMMSCWGVLAFIKACDTRQNASFAVKLSAKRQKGGERA